MQINTDAQLDRHFQGYARVKLDNIDFDSGRDLDDRNVNRLIDIFKSQGCKRESTANAISVLVQRSAIEEALARQGSSSLAVHSIVPAQLPYLNAKVLCLQGKHRIHAARKVLPYGDWWWTVKIFDSDLPLYAQEHVRYDQSNALALSAGEIFRHHLDAERRGDESSDIWLSKLSSHARDRVRQLKKDDALCKAWSELIPFAGLWTDCDLGALNRELPMRCREEQCCYLRFIHHMWSDILGQGVDPHNLDLRTVRLFQHLMPANSSCDAWTICESFRKFDAFPHVRSSSVRQKLQVRVLCCERIVTLKSFHRDTIVLEGCYQPLRSLFQVGETTLRGECEALFRHGPEYFSANYTDLWLYAMRNYPWLSNHSSATLKKDGYGDEPVHRPKSNAEVSKLASFAASRGFYNANIANLLQGYRIQIHTEPVGAVFPKLTCSEANIPRHNRCSLPRVDDFEQAWKQLSLQNVFQIQTQPSQEYSTAFAVARDIFRCFLGSNAPNEIDSPKRILRIHELMEHHHDLGAELQDLSYQGFTAVESGLMQGVSQDRTEVPSPASSVYSRSGLSPPPQSCSRYRSTVGGQGWSEEGIIELYRCRGDVSGTGNDAEGHEVEGDVHGASFQANESNGDAMIRVSPDARTNSPAKTPMFQLPLVDSNLQGERLEVVTGKDQVERAHDTLDRIEKEGHRRHPHRVEKPQHYNDKKKRKQKQSNLTRALTALQGEYIDLAETEHTEVDNVSSEAELQNLQSRDNPEQSVAFSTYGEPHCANQSSTVEASSVSNSELAVPELVHDERGIEDHLHDTEQGSQRTADQWYNHGEYDDVQTATRKAEEQMCGAEEAVNEVYDEESAGPTQQTHVDETKDGVSSHDTIPVAASTTSDLFPGGPIMPAPGSTTDPHETTKNSEALTASEIQGEPSEGNTSFQDKRKAIYHETGSLNEADNSAIPRARVPAFREEDSGIAAVSGDAPISTDRPKSLFPGGSLDPGNTQPVMTNEQSSSHPTLSKKRHLPTESEDTGGHSRQPKPSNQARIPSWEPFRETVNAIETIRHNLDRARIYVTSSVNIEELSAQQHSNQERLWSWLKGDRELFDRQVSSLLAKKFGFQVICSDANLQGRRYCSLEHMEYWNAYFGNNERGYWLAVLTPWRSAESSREKVRKTYVDNNP